MLRRAVLLTLLVGAAGASADGGDGAAVSPAQGPLAVAVDPTADRRPIRSGVYGVNFGSAAQLADPGFPARRWGGNSTTRYNWRTDVHNTASDWFFMNIVGQVSDPGALPDGSAADVFVGETLAAGAHPILTVPTIGFAPLDVREKRWGFSVVKYGLQTATECTATGYASWCTDDAGNGLRDPGGEPIAANDPDDTSQAIGADWVTDWMTHLAGRHGTAAGGGPSLWALDNEPMLWSSTHRDVHPQPLSYDGLWDATVTYAGAIKAAEPAARVLGPVVWGWCAYFGSAVDAADGDGSCTDGVDRQAHGGLALVPWYLAQVCAHQQSTGVRLVDLLDVHYYPQGGVFDGGEDPATAARRLRSVKDLYDPTYVSESWIGQPVQLIPRLRGWIDAYCPGLGLALTEYSWGRDDDGATSALAQAEVLAVLGREGVDLATRWTAPAPGSRVEDAFRLYLSYDGAGARVVGESVRAVSADVDLVGAYAVRGGDQLLSLLLLNKDTVAHVVAVTVAAPILPEVALYRFDGATPLQTLAPTTAGTSGFDLELPPRSATLARVRLDSPTLFADGFESTDTWAWSAAAP